MNPPPLDRSSADRSPIDPALADRAPAARPVPSRRIRLPHIRELRQALQRSTRKGWRRPVWWVLEGLLALLLGSLIFDRVVMPRVVRQGKEIVVPEITGMNVSKAEERLRAAGLEPGVGPSRFSVSAPRNQVISAVPPAGLKVKRGRQVFLTISLGTEDRRVPEVTGLSHRLASVQLQEAGIRVAQVAYASSDQSEPDKVLAMTPAAGSVVPPSGEVALLLSRARAPLSYWLPDLRGRDSAEAVAWLRASGFQADAPFSPPGSVVVSQDPPPGSMIWRGTTVRLEVTPGGGPSWESTPSWLDRNQPGDGRRRDGSREERPGTERP